MRGSKIRYELMRVTKKSYRVMRGSKDIENLYRNLRGDEKE